MQFKFVTWIKLGECQPSTTNDPEREAGGGQCHGPLVLS